VRAERHAPDWAIPLEGAELLPRDRVPQRYRVVLKSRGQALTIGAEGQSLARALEGENLLARLGIPHLHRVNQLATTECSAHGQLLAVRAEDHTGYRTRMPLDGQDFLARLGIPYLHGVVPAARGQPLAVGAEAHTPDSAFVPPEGEE